jgi:hypothetical protein
MSQGSGVRDMGAGGRKALAAQIELWVRLSPGGAHLVSSRLGFEQLPAR